MIDERDFFREATMRICGSLEIEKALWKCFMFIRESIPADFMAVSLIDSGLNSVEIIAAANVAGGKTDSIVKPLLPSARRVYEEGIRENLEPPVFIADRLGDYADLNVPIFSDVGLPVPESALMVLRIKLDERILGFISVSNRLGQKYSEVHARMFSLLNEPFAIALSNYIRYRELARLKDILADDNRYLQKELLQRTGHELIGADFGLKRTMEMAHQVAPLASPVLLLGETGTGKEMIASAIHNLSPRKDGPFIKVNCGAIPETLIDSELFGHEKGAFTGALAQKRGRFERAHNGTIFLDEIGELPPDAQVRLLRVLQEKEIERVGGTEPIRVDIRVIAATHRNLEQLLSVGRFREDLYFRINVFPIVIPPLRDRLGDIPALVHHFMKKCSLEMGMVDVPGLAPGAMDSLTRYSWPGNVRELQNIVERALILSKGAPLAFDGLGAQTGQKESAPKIPVFAVDRNLDQAIADYIARALDQAEGRVGGPNGAASLLDVNPATLRAKMKKLGVPFGKRKIPKQGDGQS